MLRQWVRLYCEDICVYCANITSARIVDYRIVCDKTISCAQIQASTPFETFQASVSVILALPGISSFKVGYKISTALAKAPSGAALQLQAEEGYSEMLAEYEKAFKKYEKAKKNPKASDKAKEMPRIWLIDQRDKDERKVSALITGSRLDYSDKDHSVTQLQ